MLAAGNDNPCIPTLNVVGMQRRGISAATIAALRQAHRLVYRQHKKLDELHAIFENDLGGCLPIELIRFLDFLQKQQAGKYGRAGEARRDAPPVEQAQVEPDVRRVA
jgi:UDP-N-acetylglucosamine acyltransferase